MQQLSERVCRSAAAAAAIATMSPAIVLVKLKRRFFSENAVCV